MSQAWTAATRRGSGSSSTTTTGRPPEVELLDGAQGDVVQPADDHVALPVAGVAALGARLAGLVVAAGGVVGGADGWRRRWRVAAGLRESASGRGPFGDGSRAGWRVPVAAWAAAPVIARGGGRRRAFWHGKCRARRLFVCQNAGGVRPGCSGRASVRLCSRVWISGNRSWSMTACASSGHASVNFLLRHEDAPRVTFVAAQSELGAELQRRAGVDVLGDTP